MKYTIWLCALIFATSVFAYDIADFTRDAKAHHSQHLTAMNGITLDVQGDITQPGQEAFTITATYSTRGNKWRADAVLKNSGGKDGFPLTVMYDGQKTWATILGMKLDVPRSDVDNRVRGYLYWEEPAIGSEVVGEEFVQGRLCWLITTPLRESDGTEVTMKSWYDKTHFVLVQSESTLDSKPLRMEFSDFRDVQSGYVIPYAMRAVQADSQIVSAHVLNAKSGAELNDEMFDSAKLEGGDFPDMSELMRTMQIFGKVFSKEVSKLLKTP